MCVVKASIRNRVDFVYYHPSYFLVLISPLSYCGTENEKSCNMGVDGKGFFGCY